MSLGKFIIGANQWGAYVLVRVLLFLTTNISTEIDPSVLSVRRQNGPIIMVANHRHESDPFTMLAVLPRKVLRQFLPMKFITANGWYFPFWLPAVACGCYPARRNWFDLSYGVDGAIKYINKGYGYCIYPEGRRVKKGQVVPAKSGVKRIIDAIETPQVILIHLEWDNKRFLRRTFRARYTLANTKDFNNAQAILDTIYELPVS